MYTHTRSYLTHTWHDLSSLQKLIATLSDKLPDGGAQLQAHKKAILERMARLNKPVPQTGLSSAVGGAIAAPVVSKNQHISNM